MGGMTSSVVGGVGDVGHLGGRALGTLGNVAGGGLSRVTEKASGLTTRLWHTEHPESSPREETIKESVELKDVTTFPADDANKLTDSPRRPAPRHVNKEGEHTAILPRGDLILEAEPDTDLDTSISTIYPANTSSYRMTLKHHLPVVIGEKPRLSEGVFYFFSQLLLEVSRFLSLSIIARDLSSYRIHRVSILSFFFLPWVHRFITMNNPSHIARQIEELSRFQ